MFFVYSLDLSNQSVKIHDYTDNSSRVESLLDRAARDFIKREQGERVSESPYNDDIPNDDGYFLRKNGDKIDVYHRKTKIQDGYVWNSYEIECNCVLQFGVSDSSINIDTTVKMPSASELPPPPPPPLPTMPFFEDLKDRLAIQREKMEMQFEDSDSDLDSVETTSLLNKLRRKAQLTIKVPERRDYSTLAYKPNVTPASGRSDLQSPFDYSNIDWGEQFKAVNYQYGQPLKRKLM